MEKNDRLAIRRLRWQSRPRSQTAENKSLNPAPARREPLDSPVRIRGQGTQANCLPPQGTKVHEGKLEA